MSEVHIFKGFFRQQVELPPATSANSTTNAGILSGSTDYDEAKPSMHQAKLFV